MDEPAGGVIRIAAVPSGSKSGLLQTVIGVSLIAVSPLAGPFSPFVADVGVAITLGGIVQLLSPQAKLAEDSNNGDTATSYVFSSAVNTTAQGNPVPLLYGRMTVGSAVISAGIEAEDYSSVSSNTGKEGLVT
jgi:predicted phage tail protein